MSRTWPLAIGTLFVAACASSQASKNASVQAARPPPAKAGSAARSTVYVDHEHGFAIRRPETWSFKSGEAFSSDNVAVPVIVASEERSAQVVVQVAPAVASPAQFAEKLSDGLKARAGFETTDVTPIPLAEGAVGFDFDVDEGVHGRVAVLEGQAGRVFVLLATWPQGAPEGVPHEVEEIFSSLKTPVP